MTYICGKCLKYLRNAEIMWIWLTSVGNDSNMWGNDLIIWQTAWKWGKWLRDLGNSQNIWEKS